MSGPEQEPTLASFSNAARARAAEQGLTLSNTDARRAGKAMQRRWREEAGRSVTGSDPESARRRLRASQRRTDG